MKHWAWEERAVIGMEPKRRPEARSDSKCELLLREGVKAAAAKAASCLRACDPGAPEGGGGAGAQQVIKGQACLQVITRPGHACM